ncbi:hypothetical protein RND81_02G201800 [Saponaria officinalis]|uniref:Uncharacterized protein n=1 Tax=Saponaria officinalis TaxID=3572 RepID=A0AAW1MUX9_SAPOF
MSYRSNKVVRTESLLDEYDIYFSHLLSPVKKKKTMKNVEQKSETKAVDKGYYEDVDAKAEEFIKKKHHKFEKWSMNNSC